MTAHDNANTARALNEAYNNRHWDAAVALTTPGVEMVNMVTGQTLQGPDGVRAFLQGWATAFPDSAVETTKVVADERAAAMEFTGRGRQTGPLEGPQGTIPPTGRAVEVPFIQMIEFDDGRIARARLYFDLAGLLTQLGILPAAAAAVGAGAGPS